MDVGIQKPLPLASRCLNIIFYCRSPIHFQTWQNKQKQYFKRLKHAQQQLNTFMALFDKTKHYDL